MGRSANTSSRCSGSWVTRSSLVRRGRPRAGSYSARRTVAAVPAVPPDRSADWRPGGEYLAGAATIWSAHDLSGPPIDARRARRTADEPSLARRARRRRVAIRSVGSRWPSHVPTRPPSAESSSRRVHDQAQRIARATPTCSSGPVRRSRGRIQRATRDVGRPRRVGPRPPANGLATSTVGRMLRSVQSNFVVTAIDQADRRRHRPGRARSALAVTLVSFARIRLLFGAHGLASGFLLPFPVLLLSSTGRGCRHHRPGAGRRRVRVDALVPGLGVCSRTGRWVGSAAWS